MHRRSTTRHHQATDRSLAPPALPPTAYRLNAVDDEGHPTQRNVLIENGILRGYLQDKLSSRITGAPATGSGRRESYEHIPMPRMTNTFMLAGESAPEDVIRSVPRGLYCANFAGGQVDITSGEFRFLVASGKAI